MLSKAKFLTTAMFSGWFLVVQALAVLLQGDAELVESMPEGDGKAMVTSVCTTCHTIGTVLSPRGNSEEWEQKVNEMIARGAQIFPDEMATIVG